MTTSTRSVAIEDIIKDLDVPNGAYEAAERRYKDLGEWLQDDQKAKSASFDPHVFPQGSFRLGTVTRPWKREDYDLDLSCKLKDGLTKSQHTQKQLKLLMGADLEAYRRERGIQERSEEKHRCWRLKYQDDLKFHMDIVPAIPETDDYRQVLLERMIKTGAEEVLARDVSQHAVSITDNRHPQYAAITIDWPVSNQEGYALWFESRMRQAQQLLESRAAMEKVAKVDDLPAYRWKTPLQRCVQILKRHRDMLFEDDPYGKPISAIITTLAARAYQGETDVEMALAVILERMGALVNPSVPRVPNPVNTQEDFADKWPRDRTLEPNFWRWLEQAQEDFGCLGSGKTELITETALRKFGTTLDATKLRKASGLLAKAGAITAGSARTSSSGTIGSSGVQNQPHRFHG
jgi:hypothetical protein